MSESLKKEWIDKILEIEKELLRDDLSYHLEEGTDKQIDTVEFMIENVIKRQRELLQDENLIHIKSRLNENLKEIDKRSVRDTNEKI